MGMHASWLTRVSLKGLRGASEAAERDLSAAEKLNGMRIEPAAAAKGRGKPWQGLWDHLKVPFITLACPCIPAIQLLAAWCLLLEALFRCPVLSKQKQASSSQAFGICNGSARPFSMMPCQSSPCMTATQILVSFKDDAGIEEASVKMMYYTRHCAHAEEA